MELVKHIEKLLEKYFEATATVEEEKELQNYFMQDQVAPHLQEYQPLFQYISNGQEEQYTRSIPLKPRNNFYQWRSIAAVALLLFGMFLGYRYQEQKKVEKEEARLAYNETVKALNLLAENFQKGTEKMAYLNEFETTKSKIYKHK